MSKDERRKALLDSVRNPQFPESEFINFSLTDGTEWKKGYIVPKQLPQVTINEAHIDAANMRRRRQS